MTRLILAICAALALTLCLSAVSQAHKVNVFCFVDGDSVVTESGYSRTRRVQQGTIEVQDAATGQVLLTGTTDDEGRYTFKIPDQARRDKLDLRVVLKASEGHQAEWVVKRDEFIDEAAADEGDANEPVDVAEPTPAPVAGTAVAALSKDELKSVIRQELAPVKHMLADLSQPGPSVTEILGGIGYIFGLCGVAAYFKSRSKA